MIPLLRARVPIDASERVEHTLSSGYINVGERVAAFERALAARLGAREVLVINSCTSALVLAMRLALGNRSVGIIASPMTFVATTTAIYQVGSYPIWVDVEERSCQIDAAASSCANSDAGAIVAVAWAGWLPDLRALRSVADERGIPLILDAAQAIGATFQGRPLCEWADYVCHSFSPTKHVTCGDGGALICRDPERAAEARKLSWFGMRRSTEGGERVPSDQDIPAWGYKFNMNEIAASIGLAGLETLDPVLCRSREIANQYAMGIPSKNRERDLPGVEPSPWFYTVFVDDPTRFISHMVSHGVACSQPHRRNDAYPFATDRRVFLPNVDWAQAHYVALPVGWWMSDEDVSRVIDASRTYPGGWL